MLIKFISIFNLGASANGKFFPKLFTAAAYRSDSALYILHLPESIKRIEISWN